MMDDLEAFITARRRFQRNVIRAFGLTIRLLGLNDPRPLCIDGHAYRRRQRARRRRKS